MAVSISSARNAQLQRELESALQRSSQTKADAAKASNQASKAQQARDTRVANETVRTARADAARADATSLQTQRTETANSARAAVEASNALRKTPPLERAASSAPPRPVTNAQGQRTGRVINITA